MKLLIFKNEKILKLEKYLDKDLRKDKIDLMKKLVKYLFLYIVIRTGINKTNLEFLLFYMKLFIVFYFWFLYHSIIFFQVKYKYHNEEIKIELEQISLKYSFKNDVLFEKEFKLNDVEKIHVIKKKIFSNPFNISLKNRIVSKKLEDRRRLKIKLLNGEIYSWGVNLDDEEMEKVKTYLRDYLKENQLEYLVDF